MHQFQKQLQLDLVNRRVSTAAGCCKLNGDCAGQKGFAAVHALGFSTLSPKGSLHPCSGADATPTAIPLADGVPFQDAAT